MVQYLRNFGQIGIILSEWDQKGQCYTCLWFVEIIEISPGPLKRAVEQPLQLTAKLSITFIVIRGTELPKAFMLQGLEFAKMTGAKLVKVNFRNV